MIRDKIITFRISIEEYKEILEKKSKFETMSEYIRKKLLE